MSEQLRLQAESEARRWRLISQIASSIAGCLDHESVVSTVAKLLHDHFHVESVALFERNEEGFELMATSPAPFNWTERWRRLGETITIHMKHDGRSAVELSSSALDIVVLSLHRFPRERCV